MMMEGIQKILFILKNMKAFYFAFKTIESG